MKNVRRRIKILFHLLEMNVCYPINSLVAYGSKRFRYVLEFIYNELVLFSAK